MSQPVTQHQVEIAGNLRFWQEKKLLRRIYTGFYQRIVALIDPALPGVVVEIGSGVGNLKTHYPSAVATDLFPNPWLDLACDGYDLPFREQAVSHLILFDVFHHLRAPRAFLREARRVLVPGGRVIVFDPYISLLSWLAYGVFHHEPIAWRAPIDLSDSVKKPIDYYAAQGNATRLFFRDTGKTWLTGWQPVHAEVLASFSYLLSGGFSKPSLYPEAALPFLEFLDRGLSIAPRLFGARCLVAFKTAGPG